MSGIKIILLGVSLGFMSTSFSQTLNFENFSESCENGRTPQKIISVIQSLEIKRQRNLDLIEKTKSENLSFQDASSLENADNRRLNFTENSTVIYNSEEKRVAIGMHTPSFDSLENLLNEKQKNSFFIKTNNLDVKDH